MWFLLLFVLIAGCNAQIFDCTNTTLTSPVNITMLYQICKANYRCNDKFGIMRGTTLSMFANYYLQTKLPYNLTYFESPITFHLCGKTIDEISMEYIAEDLADYAEFNPCNSREEFDPATEQCNDKRGHESKVNVNSIGIACLGVIILLQIIRIGMKVWKVFRPRSNDILQQKSRKSNPKTK
jgi:hypothetical protein